MPDASSERARLTPGRRFSARSRTLRRASLLIGTSFLFHAASALAANECGPPPPGGGTVTCPSGEYPGGIDYAAPADLEILLDLGVVTRSESTIVSAGDLRLIGPTDTSLNAIVSGNDRALDVEGLGTVRVELDSLSRESFGGDVNVGVAEIGGVGSVTFIANDVTSSGDGNGFDPALSVRQSAGGTDSGVLVQVGSVVANGINSSAVAIAAETGVARIEAGSIRTGGSYSDALRISGPIVSVEVDAIGTSGFSSHGILASGGTIDIKVGEVEAAGPFSIGISASATGDITLVADSVVTQSRDVSTAIQASSQSGDVIITVRSVEVGAGLIGGFFDGGDGIIASSVSGNVVIDSQSARLDNAFGDVIRATSQDGDVTVNNVSAFNNFGDGLIATSTAGAVTVNSGSVENRNGFGILAASDTGPVIVTSSSVSSDLSFDNFQAISASSRTGPVTVTSGMITAVGGPGIRATSETGAVTVSADHVEISGSNPVAGADAIFASSGTGPVEVTAGMVSSTDGAGIRASGDGGPVSVTAGSVAVNGFGMPGISATGVQGSVAVNSGLVATTGEQSDAIVAVGTNGDVTVVSGEVETAAAQSVGLRVSATGSGDVTVTSGDVTTQGPDSAGIRADAATGAVTVTSNGTVATAELNSEGIHAAGASVGLDSAAITTAGGGSRGIEAIATGGVDIASGAVATVGPDSTGIFARSAGGDIRIVSGTIATQGAGSAGIDASSESGTVIVTATDVSVAGAQADAILISGGGGGQVIVLGLVQSQQGLAVQADGGAAVLGIAASGTVLGRIDLTDSGDRVDNAGLFDALGTSAFGGGADLFANLNGGTIRSVNGASVLAGLESFTNQGLIEMRDGATGDSVTLTGAYSGIAGGRLGLDVDFATSTADRLVTGAATGSTLINLTTSGVASGFGSILLVDAGAGTSPTAFSLAAAAVDSPYLVTRLRFDAADSDFLLVHGPGAAAFETVRFAAMANRLWHESADAVAAQLDTARDGRGGRGIGLWLQGWSGEVESDGRQSFGGETFDVSFRQDFQGLQGGLDFQTGSVAVGITTGAGRSDATFLATGNPVDMEVRNIGAYVQGRSGLLFFNALAKFDWAELEIAPGSGLGASFDADLFGIQANAGVRLGFGSVFAEPSVGLSWVQSEVEAFASGPAAVGPGEGESLRARAGLRVGARLPLGGGALLPFVAVNAYEELGGENSSDFTLGDNLRLFDESPGTRGQAAAGVSFSAGSFEAFVRGDIDFNGKSDSKSVRAGARLRF